MSDELRDSIETAWGIIANVSGGDWEKQSAEWQQAAARWRDSSVPLFTKNIQDNLEA